ncbi:MAG: type II toxin-antitoxin system Phd/YefM family antitoxin [Sulfurisoma sp.]|nr:type II toxin-antitoxin system Phd/YefM family antitoxin [Sulfurisoma sp.]
MDRTCSIAEARNDLSGVVREAEAGHPVTLSRRGKPVAVILSAAAFARAPQTSTGEVADAFRKTHAGDLDNTDWVPARNAAAEDAHRERMMQAIAELRRFRESCLTGKVGLRKMIEADRR